MVSTLKDPKDWLIQALGVTTASSIAVNEENSRKLAAVFSCVKVLSETLASLPIHLYIQNGNMKEVDSKNSLHNLISSEPSSLYTSYTWRLTSMNHLTTWGNSFSIIHRNDFTGEAEWLEIIHPDKVKVYKYQNELFYAVNGYKDFIPAANMLHFLGFSDNGIIGKSPIRIAAETIGNGLDSQSFIGKFFKNGTHINGFLEIQNELSDAAYQRLKESWKERKAGMENTGTTPILEGGTTYKTVTMPLKDAQFIEGRKFNRSEICGIFRVPPHMIQDLERSTNNNIEHQSIEFVMHTMNPYFVAFEQELNRKLILGKRKGRNYFKFNVNGLLRGDAKSRSQFYKDLFGIGAIQPDEIRSLEDMNATENGNKTYVPLNMVPSDQIMNVIGKNNTDNNG